MSRLKKWLHVQYSKVLTWLDCFFENGSSENYMKLTVDLKTQLIELLKDVNEIVQRKIKERKIMVKLHKTI